MGRPPKLSPAQKAEVRELVRHATYRSVGEAFGVTESTISRIVGPRSAIGRPPERPGPCAICKEPKGALRFALHRADGVYRTTRGAGSIALCEPCWRRVAAPYRRPRHRRLGGVSLTSGLA